MRGYVTLEIVWNVMQGVAIRQRDAQKIRQALWEAGAPYDGYLAVYPDEAAEQLPPSASEGVYCEQTAMRLLTRMEGGSHAARMGRHLDNSHRLSTNFPLYVVER
jgi:hypothetical protein